AIILAHRPNLLRISFARVVPVDRVALAAISCQTIVIITANVTDAHKSAYPLLVPATILVVIVPVPIKAPATSIPGPILLKASFHGVGIWLSNLSPLIMTFILLFCNKI